MLISSGMPRVGRRIRSKSVLRASCEGDFHCIVAAKLRSALFSQRRLQRLVVQRRVGYKLVQACVEANRRQEAARQEDILERLRAFESSLRKWGEPLHDLGGFAPEVGNGGGPLTGGPARPKKRCRAFLWANTTHGGDT